MLCAGIAQSFHGGAAAKGIAAGLGRFPWRKDLWLPHIFDDERAFEKARRTPITPRCGLNQEEYTMSVNSKQSIAGTVGKDVSFERIRRITGYLVGTMDKWNDAKRAEEKDRVKHL